MEVVLDEMYDTFNIEYHKVGEKIDGLSVAIYDLIIKDIDTALLL